MGIHTKVLALIPKIRVGRGRILNTKIRILAPSLVFTRPFPHEITQAPAWKQVPMLEFYFHSLKLSMSTVEFLKQKRSQSIKVERPASPEVTSDLHQGRPRYSGAFYEQTTTAKIPILPSTISLEYARIFSIKSRILARSRVWGLHQRLRPRQFRQENSTFTTQN
jgi:hypothetical protein